MVRPLNPPDPLFSWRRKDASAQKLYGAIVAQARLPVFYQSFGVPDTLEGRFVLLSLNLFAVLHRLKAGGAEAQDLAQELMDQFSADMETVLREVGVGDLSIPKKMRGLVASSAALLQSYEEAYAAGEGAVAGTIARSLAPRRNACRGCGRPPGALSRGCRSALGERTVIGLKRWRGEISGDGEELRGLA